MATHGEEDQVGDIEKQLPHTSHDQSPPATITDPTTENPHATDVENDNDNKEDIEAAESVVNDLLTTTTTTTTTTTSMKTTTTTSSMVEITIIVIVITILTILAILLSPFALAYVIGSICINGKIQHPATFFSSKKDDRSMSKFKGRTGIFIKMLMFESPKQKFQRLNLTIVTRAGCIALVWLVVNLCVPSLRIVTLFHYPLWKWNLIAVIILLGYTVSTIAVFTLFWVIWIFNVLFNVVFDEWYDDEFPQKSNLNYVFIGLRNSLISLLYFVNILVMWLCYFRTDHGLRPSESVDKFGTCTFVSLWVGSILWVLKSATLLKWKANAVHKRFKGRILMAGFQLYFLTHVNIDGLHFNKYKLLHWWKKHHVKEFQRSTTQPPSDGVAKDRTNLRIQDFVLSKSISVNEIDMVATKVTYLAKVTQRENDGNPDIVAKCREIIPTQGEGDIVQALIRNFKLDEEDAQLLLQELKGDSTQKKELKGEQSPDKITHDTFQKWMVDAYKKCLSVGYTLIDAFAVVSVLNRILIGFIIVVVILIWLLITGLATTKVLVLIASPFVTFSFMFGDTCKTFFQGIIFSFVTHPYDVGDRCKIEGIELEVKRIGILTTTFLRIGTKEKMIYPNASLATKLITNLEGEPDPTDTIELILDSSTTKSKILELKNDLERFFESTKRDYEKNIHLAVKEIGSSIKVSVSFTHVMNVHDVSHSQCLQKKNKQRSELLIDIKQFLENREIKLATP